MKKKIGVLTTLVVICIIYLTLSKVMNIRTIKNDKVMIFVDSKVITEDDIEIKEETGKVIVNTNEILVGRMSGYGPDCVGCTGYLAYNSIYVGNGTIYYEDSEYGKVRIVAGDKKYPFGTIVRVNDSMNVIVLDRGGAIGIGKSFLFDLLFPSEYEANMNGILVDAKFEILRYGF